MSPSFSGRMMSIAAKALREFVSSLEEGARVEDRSAVYFAFITSMRNSASYYDLEAETWQDENSSRRNGTNASQTSSRSVLSSGSRDSVLTYISTSYNPIEEILPGICNKDISITLGVSVKDVLKIIILDLDSKDCDILLGCVVLFTWLLSKQWPSPSDSKRMVSVADFRPKDVTDVLFKILLKFQIALDSPNMRQREDYVRFVLYLLSNQHADSAVLEYKGLITNVLLKCLLLFKEDVLLPPSDAFSKGVDERFVSALSLRALVRVCRQHSMSSHIVKKLDDSTWTALLHIVANHLEMIADGDSAASSVLESVCWLAQNTINSTREHMRAVVESGFLKECVQRVLGSIVKHVYADGKERCNRFKQVLRLLTAVGTLEDGRTGEKWLLSHIVGLASCLQSIRLLCTSELDWCSCVAHLAETVCRVPWDGDDKLFKITVRTLLQLVEPRITDDEEVLAKCDCAIVKCTGRVVVELAGWPGARGAALIITARSSDTTDSDSRHTAKDVVAALASLGSDWKSSTGRREAYERVAMLQASGAQVAADALRRLACSTDGVSSDDDDNKAAYRWQEGIQSMRLVVGCYRRLLDCRGATIDGITTNPDSESMLEAEQCRAETALHCAFWSQAGSIVRVYSIVDEARAAELHTVARDWCNLHLQHGTHIVDPTSVGRAITDFLGLSRVRGEHLCNVLVEAEAAALLVRAAEGSSQGSGLALCALPVVDAACALGTPDSAKRLLIGDLRAEQAPKRVRPEFGPAPSSHCSSGDDSVCADAVVFTLTQIEATQIDKETYVEAVESINGVSAEEAVHDDTEIPPNSTFQPPQQQDTHNTARTASTELVNTYAEANGGVENTYNDSNQVFDTNNQLYSFRQHAHSPNPHGDGSSILNTACPSSLDSYLTTVLSEGLRLTDRERVHQLIRKVAQLQAELTQRLCEL